MPALVAAVLAGCGAGQSDGGVAGVAAAQTGLARSPTVPGGWASAAEVRWLGRLAGWTAAFADAGRVVARFESGPRFDAVLAGDGAALAAYRRVLRPVRDCGRTFREAVGAAPTARLARSARGYLDACAAYRRGADLILRSLAVEDDALGDRARDAIDRADRLAAAAAGTLPPGEKQALPVRGGRTHASRIEPRASAAAAELGGKRVEVRCWSSADWERLLVEERALTHGKVNGQALGFASAGGERLNLAPPICAALVDLVYARARPGGGDGLLRLALAVETLSHEAEHAAGVADEAAAECRGIQAMEEAAAALGVDRGFALRLQQRYWSTYDGLPPVYRSSACRAGGALDAEPGRASFP